MAAKMWFAQLPGKRGPAVWVRVRRNGGLNDGDRARFGVSEVKGWLEVEAATVSAAKVTLAAGGGTPCGNAAAPVKPARKAKPAVKGTKKGAGKAKPAAPAPVTEPAPVVVAA